MRIIKVAKMNIYNKKNALLICFCCCFRLLVANDLPAVNENDSMRRQKIEYAVIEAHPRLLLTAAKEIELKNNLRKNPYLASVHRRILNVSNDIIKTDLLKYEKEGIRLLNVSREALKRIFYLSYAYRLNKNVLYLRRAEQEMLTICNFPDWNPSHFLDTGEMAMALAFGYDWLYYDLKKETLDRVCRALIEKAFEPSKEEQYNRFLTAETNWNQVCNAGLTLAALAIYDEAKSESGEIIERSVESLKIAAREYAPDGNYAEGFQYWFYGTTFHVLMLACLESAVGSDMDLHKMQGFMKSAEYLLYMVGPAEQAFNYSDSGSRLYPNVAMFWFAQKSKNPSLLYWEKQLLEKKAYTQKFREERLLPALMALDDFSSLDQVLPPASNAWIGKGVAPVALFHINWGKENAQYLGIKGGKAATPHAHMDAGSFVYDADGLRWAMDFGMENYAAIEKEGISLWNIQQNSDRWNLFRLNNKSHNTLTINDKLHNVDGEAVIVRSFSDEKECGATVDLSPVFSGEVDSVLRTVKLANDELHIEDVIYTNPNEATLSWRMATKAKPTIDERHGCIKLEHNGKVRYLVVESEQPVTFATWSTTPTNGYESKNSQTYLVGFESRLPARSECVLKVRLTKKK